VQFQDPLAIACPCCAASQLKSVHSLLALAATCDSCGSKLDVVGEQLRGHLDDWGSYLGMIEVAMAVERRFRCNLLDIELEKLDTVEAFASLVAKKVARPVEDEVRETICTAIRSQRPGRSEAEVVRHSLRSLLSHNWRADA
jgi:hypothetical protein